MANLKDLIVNGAARIIGKTYSSEFVGNVTGNVTGNVAGNLTGNVTGNVSGSSGSCTGNAKTATTADKTAYGISVKDSASNLAVNGWNGSKTGTLTIAGTSPVATAATAGTITITHDKKGPATATSGGDTTAQAPGFGETFKVTSDRKSVV